MLLGLLVNVIMTEGPRLVSWWGSIVVVSLGPVEVASVVIGVGRENSDCGGISSI